MSAEELKLLISTPLGLFILMILGSIVSMLKQYLDAKANSSTITLGNYLLRIETVVTIALNIFAFAGLIMTDTLNWTNASAIGFAMNSLADLSQPGTGRSAEIIKKTE